MLSVCKELKNIPISISILHDQEYNNLCKIFKISIKTVKDKRRAYSERSEVNKLIQQFLDSPNSHS